MKSVEATPTRPAHYALISGTYAGLFAAVAWASRDSEERLGAYDLTTLGLATFTLTRVLTEQKVEVWLRQPFVEEPADGPRRPRGRGMRFAIGELLSCTRCTGAWVGLGLVGVRLRSPQVGRLIAAAGTVGAINDTALAGFAWLAGRANAAADDGGHDGAPGTIDAEQHDELRDRRMQSPDIG